MLEGKWIPAFAGMTKMDHYLGLAPVRGQRKSTVDIGWEELNLEVEFSNSLSTVQYLFSNFYQQTAFLYGPPRDDVNPLDNSRRSCSKFVLHLHGLHDDEPLPSLNSIAFGNANIHNKPGHWGFQVGNTARGLGRSGLLDCSPSFIERIDFETFTVDPNRVVSTPRLARSILDLFALECYSVDSVTYPKNRGMLGRETLERSVQLSAVHRDALSHCFHRESLVVDDNRILHGAPSRTSSQTVSTCAVCGNMSKQCSDLIENSGRRARSRASVAGLQLT